MQRRVLTNIKVSRVRQFSASSASSERPLGFIGLGHMGGKMVENLSKDGRKVLVFDASKEAIQKVVAASAAGNKSVSQASMEEIAQKCSVIFSMLPNDQVSTCFLQFNVIEGFKSYHEWLLQVVSSVTDSLIKGNTTGNTFTHISCSTISPSSARRLAETHKSSGHKLITAPVFARPDGSYHLLVCKSNVCMRGRYMWRTVHIYILFPILLLHWTPSFATLTGIAKRQATWMLGGEETGRALAGSLLSSLGNIVDMGNDVGAANVVKLCGNFLIAVSCVVSL